MKKHNTMRAFITYVVGILCIGIGIGFAVKANLGVQSWQAFEVGILNILGLPAHPWYQLIVFIESASMLPIGYYLLQEKPGWGTIPIAIMLGPISQIPIWLLPHDPSYAMRWFFLIFGGLVVSLGIGLYLNGNFGPSPQDVVYMGLINKFGLKPSQAKVVLDGGLTVVGFALGGFKFGDTIGWGTLAMFLLIAGTVDYTMAFGAHLVQSKAEREEDSTDSTQTS